MPIQRIPNPEEGKSKPTEGKSKPTEGKSKPTEGKSKKVGSKIQILSFRELGPFKGLRRPRASKLFSSLSPS
jgi:hypothetical protein